MSNLFSMMVVLGLLAATSPFALAAGAVVRVDCARTVGTIRPLHGVNDGPIAYGGLVDLSPYYRELAIPSTRLHDCHWPNPDVVDIHTIFPDFAADPERPESYRFARTDDYLKAVVATGSGIVYRLGESIEHTRTKYHVHPPSDPAKWAAVCVGIIRHYNEGWADGLKLGIRYWEIWNEPENRPAMWTGTDEDFLRLYVAAAKAIKARFPSVLVGGPGFGYCGEVAGTALKPTPFAAAFLERCKKEGAALDFFSWHRYTDDPYSFHQQAVAVRALLDANGFQKTESHLNEWNYLPNNDWGPLSLAGQGLPRQRFFEALRGPAGAAFVACALLYLQDSPVDVANYYRGDIGGFGLFTDDGVPGKAFYAFKAFKWLLDTPRRVAASGSMRHRLAAAAGLNAAGTELTVLISNYRSAYGQVALAVEHVPWEGQTSCQAFLLDGATNLKRIADEVRDASELRFSQPLKAPAVLVVKLRKAGAGDTKQ